MIRFFDPGKGYQKIRREVLNEVDRILSGGDLILRNDVEKFEDNLAKFVGKKYAVALNSGTDALYLSLVALGITPGDEVIVPSHTFVATAQVVNQIGATPVLVDIDGDFNEYITDKTKAIIPAHIAGEVLKWESDLPTIEDACQALGAKSLGYGDVQCWSFYPAKILGAYGDGGGITTDSKYIADEIRELRNHYKKDYSQWGVNSRMDNLQAAILNIKLRDLPKYLERREEIADRYISQGILPSNKDSEAWQDFIFYVGEQRDELYEYLKKENIETMKNEYPFPIPKGIKSIEYEASTLRLPCNPELTNQEIDKIIHKIKSFKWR